MQREVCWHNGRGSPVQDTCGVDGKNCVMLNDDQKVVCWHTGFREPCNQQNKCRTDGKSCIILTKPQTVVCYHENYLDFGRPNNPNCNCTNIDGEHVRLLPNAPVAAPPALEGAMLRKVCWHNWAGSPVQDTCGVDGKNCVMLNDDQKVVCWHTGFREPCNQQNKCRIDGKSCIILTKPQTVVCYHENYLDFGRPNNPNCNCTNIDGEHVRLLPNAPVAAPPAFAPGAHATIAMIKCSNRHNWTPCTGTCGCGSADGENIVYLTETEQVVCWNTNLKGRLDDPTMKVVGSIDGLNCFIMDKSQSIRWLTGKSITEYREYIDNWSRAAWATDGEAFKLDPFASVCKLMNRPFPKKMTGELWKQSAIVVMDVWDLTTRALPHVCRTSRLPWTHS